MDFFEQVKKTASDVAQVVTQKSNEVLEISKIKYAIHDLNSDIKKLYIELGKLTYEELKGNSALSDDMQIKCEIIDAKRAKIAALKKKEQQVRREITCPNCGRECGDADESCPYCGAKIAVEVDVEIPEDDVNKQEEA